MTQPIPTITDVLIQTSTANCQHSWPVEGGSITAYRRAANAGSAARDAIIRYRRETNV